jgi:glycosyltransferase involved in cell wall biosynthesis
MQEKKHIVFFTPTLNKTGSEIVLFNLLPFALKDFKVTVITKYKGELYNQLPVGIHKHYLYNKQFGGLISKLMNRFRSIFVVPSILKKYQSAVWYLNTIMLSDILEYAENNKIPTFVHLHELQQMYKLLSQQDINRLVSCPKFVIANSIASLSVLKNFGRIKPIEIIYPSLDFSKINKPESKLRNELGINQNDFVWLMSGTLDKNKNPFLFVDIAKSIKQKTGGFKMIWLGAQPNNSNLGEEFKQYIRKKNCEDVVLWVSKVEDKYYDYLNCANGFVLTSQFESFSLVTLEALYLGKPVVANNCIGVNEILIDKYGYVLKEKNNVEEMSEIMRDYKSGSRPVFPSELKQRALNFNVDKIGKDWLKCLKEQV